MVFFYYLPLKQKPSSFDSHPYKEGRSLFQVTLTNRHVRELIYTFS